MARLRAALRVNHPTDQTPVLETPDFTLDLAAKRARRGTRDIHLTATEWQIVDLLARNPGRLITQTQLLEHVWGLKNTKNNYVRVRVYLAAIRRKLEPDPTQPRYFLTEPRSGIRFDPGAVRNQPQDPESPPSDIHLDGWRSVASCPISER
jgi:two-component system KDP operon response regulator KdpE